MKKLYLFAVKRFLPVVLLCGFAGSSYSALVGSTAPSFTLKDQNNISTSLEDYRGQGVILDFCATWCTVCRDIYDPDFAFALASLDGFEMFLPILMEGDTAGTRILSTDSTADFWADRFDLQKVLHMSGDRDLYYELLPNYMQGLNPRDAQAYAFPTYVFLDADLEVVGNFVGLPGSRNAIKTWNRYVADIEISRLEYVEPPTQVPEPATLFLTAIGLVAISLRCAKTARHPKQAMPRWGGTLTSCGPTRDWLSAS
jgi:hypothetical protein